jgi:ATP-dependent RNA helicase DDX10/DBP4
VYLQKNKKVFDIKTIEIDAFSFSMGLPNAPRLRFLQQSASAGGDASASDDEEDADGEARAEEEESASGDDDDSDDDDASDDDDEEDEDGENDEDEDSEEEEDVPARPKEGVIQRKGGGRFGLVVEQGEDDDDDFMNVKRVDHKLADSDSEDDKKYNADEKAAEIARKRALKGKLKIKESGHGANKRVVFDEEGTSMAPLQALGVKSGIDDVSAPGESLRAAVKAHYAEVAAKRKEADRVDKGREKARLREGRMRKKQKLRDFDGEGGGAEVTLGGGSDSESDLDLSESDFDEREVPRKRDVVDPAVAGMRVDAEEKLESLEERALRLLEG